VQDICQRIEKAYQLFFKHHKKGVRPPNFKKIRRYKSFTLKQAGYKFFRGNRIKIGGVGELRYDHLIVRAPKKSN
jgi:putative transposase